MKSTVAIAIRSILMIVAIAIFIVGLCLTITPYATRVAAKELQDYTNNNFQYKDVSGVLYGPITFKAVSYTIGDYQVKADTLTVEVGISAILKKRLQLDSVKADHVNIIRLNEPEKLSTNQPKNAITTQPQTTSTQPQTISTQTTLTPADIQQLLKQFKYELNIDQLSLNDIHYYSGNRLVSQLKTLNGQLIFSKDKIKANLRTEILSPEACSLAFQIEGKPNAYTTNLTVTLKDFSADAKGSGTLSGFHINFQPNHSMTGNAKITWLPNLQWNINVIMNQIPLAFPFSKQPYKASAQIIGQGTGEESNIAITQIQIPANQSTITGSATLTLLPGQTQKLAVNLSAGNATVTIYAEKQADWHLNWAINIPNLNDIIKDSAGSITSSGTANNLFTTAHSKGQFNINHFAIPILRIDQLTAQWVFARDKKLKNHIDLNFSGVQYKKIILNQGNINLSGDLLTQQMKIDIDSNDGRLQATVMGGPSLSGNWVGNLYDVDWNSKQFGHWQVSETPAITINKNSFTLPKTCMNNEEKASTCLSADWQKDQGWHIDFSADNHSLEPIAKLFNPELSINGNVSLTAQLKGKSRTIDSGKIILTLPAGTLKLSNSAESYQQAYLGGETKITINQDGTEAETHFKINNDNYLYFNIALPQYHQLALPSSTQKITGELKIEWNDLKVLSAFIPDTVKTEGQLQAEMELTGTLSKPLLQGNVNLSKATVNIPTLDITLQNANLLITGQNDRVDFSGKIFSGEEAIAISGYSYLDKTGLPTHITINGHDILVMDTPQYQIYATPDLRLDIKDKILWVKGDLYLPKARIKPEDTFNTITLPDDVVIISDNEDQANQTHGWHLGMDVRVTAGDDVIYDADGIVGRIEGSLQIIKKPSSPMLGNGQLDMVDGVYQAHATKLKIAEGQLTFHNTPINNPSLNVKAVRIFTNNDMIDSSINGLTVGVQIQGTIKKPKTKLFSTPIQLSDADILSYILFGQSINPYNSLTTIDTGKAKDRSQGANIALLIQAANALTPNTEKGGSKSILGKIQQSLGFQELGIEDSSNIDPWKVNFDDQSALVAGKYLTPKLYVRYAKDLNDSNSNNVVLRYRLNKQFALQAGGSTSSDSTDSKTSVLNKGVDLIYTFTRK